MGSSLLCRTIPRWKEAPVSCACTCKQLQNVHRTRCIAPEGHDTFYLAEWPMLPIADCRDEWHRRLLGKLGPKTRQHRIHSQPLEIYIRHMFATNLLPHAKDYLLPNCHMQRTTATHAKDNLLPHTKNTCILWVTCRPLAASCKGPVACINKWSCPLLTDLAFSQTAFPASALEAMRPILFASEVL